MSTCDIPKVDGEGDKPASSDSSIDQLQSSMRNVSIQLPADHSPTAHSSRKQMQQDGQIRSGVADANSKAAGGALSKIPDLLDTMSGDSEDYCPSLTSVSVASHITHNTVFSGRSGVTMSSLRSDHSGSLMDDTFDDLSDGDESDAEVECRRRAADWRHNSLMAAVAASPAVGRLHGKDGGSEKGRMLIRSDTMEVVEKSHGTQALTAGCHVPEETDFANQYLSTLFCGLGEVMGCGGR